jgi:hypothetical protein
VKETINPDGRIVREIGAGGSVTEIEGKVDKMRPKLKIDVQTGENGTKGSIEIKK